MKFIDIDGELKTFSEKTRNYAIEIITKIDSELNFKTTEKENLEKMTLNELYDKFKIRIHFLRQVI